MFKTRSLCAASTLLFFSQLLPAAEESIFSNRLAEEKSPYLLQHAQNPVNWYPWGEEAFALAREQDLPIFLSIGYATCHWCHVMEHESFEDPEVAKYLNEHFIPIKVDREERPDIDRIYMAYQNAIYGHGGWPLNLWLTPERQPFASGTYFPPTSSGGRPSFRNVLEQIASVWETNKNQVKAQAADTTGRMQEALAITQPSETTKLPGDKVRDKAQQILAARFDSAHGGFGDAPKFPTPGQLNFLLQRASDQELEEATRTSARKMVRTTLGAMADGGIHDHLGGGFHRYSVDRYWRVPHFEKMLYDQAQLASCYLELHLLTSEPRWAEVAQSIFSYVERQLSHPDGAFFSAEDADSLPPDQPEGNKTEGAFFLWSADEIATALGEADAKIFNQAYGIETNGNTPAESDPHGEFTDLNILYRKSTDQEVAEAQDMTTDEINDVLRAARSTLFAQRAPRPRPSLDDKVITAWNGLMISAYCRAYQVLGDPLFLERAQKATDFILAELSPNKGDLLRSYREGASNIPGFAEDYAFFIAALLDLYESDFDSKYLQAAVDLQEGMIAKLHDPQGGGFFDAPAESKDLIVRMKNFDDGAEPAANSIAARNLLRLSAMLGREDFAAAAQGIAKTVAPTLERAPHAALHLLNALGLSSASTTQLIIAGHRGSADTRALASLAYAKVDNRRILFLADGANGQELAAQTNEAISQMKPIEGAATLYLCKDFTCKQPTNEPDQAARLINETLGARTLLSD